MNILLIDNGSYHSDELEQTLKEYGKVKRLKYRRNARLDHAWAELIVLSGSHIRGSFWGLFSNEMKLVQNTNKPVIGICYGFELIATAYGDKIVREKKAYEGIYDIALSPELLGTEYTTHYKVAEAHHWVLRATSLQVLGTSERGVEAIRHPTKAIFGLQFHPEVVSPKNDGQDILRRLIRYVLITHRNLPND